MKVQTKNPLISIVLGGLIVLIGILFHFNQKSFTESAKEAKGVVIDIKEKYVSSNNESLHQSSRNSQNNNKEYFPIIKYKTKAGDEVTFTSIRGSRNINSYKIGEEVTVLYDPKQPIRARLKTKAMNYESFIFAGVGVLFIVFGIFKYKKRKE